MWAWNSGSPKKREEREKKKKMTIWKQKKLFMYANDQGTRLLSIRCNSRWAQLVYPPYKPLSLTSPSFPLDPDQNTFRFENRIIQNAITYFNIFHFLS